MPPGDRQRMITDIAAEALNVPVTHNPTFKWLRNVHTEADFGMHFAAIDGIFKALGGSAQAQAGKRPMTLKSDAYFGGSFNCLVEYDEFQHFSSARGHALRLLPQGIPLGFSRSQYAEFCRVRGAQADDYRRTKHTSDFNFDGGRTAQRAYFDCFRDLLPVLHGLRPTLRIAEFEVAHVSGNSAASRELLKRLLEEKIGYSDLG